jgi:hypothetical protein
MNVYYYVCNQFFNPTCVRYAKIQQHLNKQQQQQQQPTTIQIIFFYSSQFVRSENNIRILISIISLRYSSMKKKAKISKPPKQPPTKVNWIFSASRLPSKDVTAVCLRLFTKEKELISDLFEYAIVGVKEVSKNAYDIFGYLQLGKQKRWTRKDVCNYLACPVKTYLSNDVVFERTEKTMKPDEIIAHIKVLADVDNITESGSLRRKGPKSSTKREESESRVL